MSAQDVDSALDCPIYDNLASAEELRLIIRLIEGSTCGTSAPSRLRIGQKLGRGSEGDVYKATFDGQRVALKVMKRRDRRTPKDWRKVVGEYLAEAKLLRICEEQNTILGLHGVVEFPSDLLTQLEGATRPSLLPGFGLILDLSQRGTLRDLVEQSMNEPGALLYSDAEALGWCIDIASGIQFLHQLKPIIIHRDIKLENVLLYDGDTRPTAKLCDFGLAAIGYEAEPRRSVRRLNSQSSRQVSRQASRSTSRVASRQSSMTSMKHVDDTASGDTNNTTTVAGARLARAAERAVAAAELEDARLQQDTTPRTSIPQIESIPGKLSTALKQANKESPSLPRRVSIAGDAGGDTTPLAGDVHTPYKGDGPNPRVLAQQLLQAQDHSNHAHHAASRAISRCSQDAMTARTPMLGGISTRRRLSVRQTVAFALPEADERKPAAGDSSSVQGGPDGAAELPNLVVDDNTNEESFNARRRLSRVSSAGSFTSRASSVSVTGRTGSLAYLAPEVDCRKTYNESADVFSFAVLMYQLFARTSLVLECRDTEGALEKLQMRMTEGYRPPRPKGCHADVWEVIEACWQPVSTDRPLMDEVMQQLEAVVIDLQTSPDHTLKGVTSSDGECSGTVEDSAAAQGSDSDVVAAAKATRGGSAGGAAGGSSAQQQLGNEQLSLQPPSPMKKGPGVAPAAPGCGCVIC